MLEALASSLALAGLSAPIITLLATRNARPGAELMLDLWTAGALLQLLGGTTWQQLTLAGALVLARSVVWPRPVEASL